MNWAALIDEFKGCQVLVVGDICLDRWCHYDPEEADLSRETGIRRVGIVKTKVTPGGGGTVANNLAALGAGRVSVLGAIGQDGFGFELQRALTARDIEYRLLVASPDIQTFTYTKVINDRSGEEDKARLDFINVKPLPGVVEDQLITNFHLNYKDFDVVVVSDQAETSEGGVITGAFREVIGDVAERNPDKVVIVDSRNRIELFRNAIAKPNAEEANEACRKLFGTLDYERLRKTLGAKPLVVTRGADGALLVGSNGEREIPAVLVEKPVDICGAGDSFAAGMALALRVTGDFEAAARFGSLVSSVTIMKKGTGVARPDEVLAAAQSMAS